MKMHEPSSVFPDVVSFVRGALRKNGHATETTNLLASSARYAELFEENPLNPVFGTAEETLDVLFVSVYRQGDQQNAEVKIRRRHGKKRHQEDGQQ